MEYCLSISKEVNLKMLDDEFLPQIKEGVKRCIVDLSNLRFITAPDAATLLLLLHYLEITSEAELILIPPGNPAILSFLSNVRFFTLAQNFSTITKSFPEPINLNKLAKRNILEIKHIPTLSTEIEFADWLSKSMQNTILGKMGRFGGGHFKELPSIYTELCKNIFEHSQSFGYVAAQILPSRQIKITIGDLGIGIFKSLTSFYDENIDRFKRRFGPMWDEAKALDIAFASGVSSKLTESDGEKGIGLYSVLQTAQEFGGTVVCRTGRNKVYLGYQNKSWTTERKSSLNFFPGTQLEVYLTQQRL